MTIWVPETRDLETELGGLCLGVGRARKVTAWLDLCFSCKKSLGKAEHFRNRQLKWRIEVPRWKSHHLSAHTRRHGALG